MTPSETIKALRRMGIAREIVTLVSSNEYEQE